MAFSLVSDLRNALRALLRTPGLTIFHIGLLASVVTILTLAFNVYEVFFLRVAAVAAPDRLFRLSYDVPNIGIRSSFTRPALEAMTQRPGVVGAAGYTEVWGIAIQDDLGVSEVRAEAVTLNFFSLLGVRIAAGRPIGNEDDERSGEIPVVISHRFWRQHYGEDADVVGKRIALNQLPARIVGVSEKAFNGFTLDTAADVRFPDWAAIRFYPALPEAWGRDVMYLDNLVLLAPGVLPSSLKDELTAAALAGEEQAAQRNPSFDFSYLASRRQSTFSLVPAALAQSWFRDRNRQALQAFLAAAGLLFLLCAANLGGLWLARTVERESELAVRLALGAGRGRLARELFTEALLLGAAAALVAVLFTTQAAPLLPSLLPPMREFGATAPRPISADFSSNPVVLAVGVAASFLATFLLAFAPAMAIQRLRPINALKRMRTARGWAGQRLFLAAQVGLSAALVVGALLATTTLRNLMEMDLGYDLDRVAIFDVNPQIAGFSGNQSGRLALDTAARVEGLPGVRRVAFGGGLLDGIGMASTFYPTGKQVSQQERMNTSVVSVSPGFFELVGQKLLNGREFTPQDDNRRNPRPMIVNQTYARRFFGSVDPIGKTMGIADINLPAGSEGIVVGVVEDAQFRSLRHTRPPLVYNMWHFYPSEPGQPDPGFLFKMYVRTDGDPHALFEPVRRIVRELAPDVPIMNATTLREQRDLSLRTDTLAASLGTTFTAFAFLVAGLGIFSLLSRMVAARTKELGVRVALGAQPSDIFGLVVRQALTVAVAGLGMGLTLAFLWYPNADDLFRGVTGRDPLILLAGAFLVLAMAVFAAFVPALRATRLQPVKALRQD